VFTTNLVISPPTRWISRWQFVYAPFDTYFVTFTTNTIIPVPRLPVGHDQRWRYGELRVEHHPPVCADAKLLLQLCEWTRTVVWSAPQPAITFLVTSNETVVANFADALEDLATDDIGRRTVSAVKRQQRRYRLQPMVLTKTSATDANRNGFFLDLSTDNLPHCGARIDTGASRGHLRERSNSAAAYRSFAIGPVQAGGQLLIDMDNGYNDVAGSAWDSPWQR